SAAVGGSKTGMTGSEDHQGSLRHDESTEVSHARTAIIADLVPVLRIGSDGLGCCRWAARSARRSA
ncbi:hypothetical protein, partial [Cryptosporangium sp. NPDC051539]|uniref:hypothetical protein n=1 Tax=Cryptosporangium sp. NPDC051539 TaxID=3363962 RepID=UPI0037A2891C